MDTPLFNNIVFVKSIYKKDQCPTRHLPEIAFIGRSNVGKSTLINTICGRIKIAKISSTPGKTILINYYMVNESYYFVDLPGYGYARLPQNMLNSLKELIENYLLNSKNLIFIFLLIDSRHNPMKADLAMIEWLNHNNLPFAVILTKIDKISKNKQNQQLKLFRSLLPDNQVMHFSTNIVELKMKLSKFIYEILNV